MGWSDSLNERANATLEVLCFSEVIRYAIYSSKDIRPGNLSLGHQTDHRKETGIRQLAKG